MTHSDRRIRYEDLNWRVVTDTKNEQVWFEQSAKDALGVTVWKEVGYSSRCTCPMDTLVLLNIFWSLLDRYTLDQEE